VFTLALTLTPGNYELRVAQADTSGNDQELNVDTRGFIVR
jgi:hypothetical protein